MTARFWLRAAAVACLFYAVGHLTGATKTWSPVGETEVLRSMRTFEFDAMGRARTYADFFVGFGMYVGVLLLMKATLLWQLGSLAEEHRDAARRLVATIGLASLVGCGVTAYYIFLLPTVFAATVAAMIALAFLRLRGSIPDRRE